MKRAFCSSWSFLLFFPPTGDTFLPQPCHIHFVLLVHSVQCLSRSSQFIDSKHFRSTIWTGQVTRLRQEPIHDTFLMESVGTIRSIKHTIAIVFNFFICTYTYLHIISRVNYFMPFLAGHKFEIRKKVRIFGCKPKNLSMAKIPENKAILSCLRKLVLQDKIV